MVRFFAILVVAFAVAVAMNLQSSHSVWSRWIGARIGLGGQAPLASPQRCGTVEEYGILRGEAAAFGAEDAFECFRAFFSARRSRQSKNVAYVPLATSKRSYYGLVELSRVSAVPAWAINLIWRGIDFHGNGTCSIVTNVPAWASVPRDDGTISYEERCPHVDPDGPCVTIDFSSGPLPRTYYARAVEPGAYLAFARRADGSFSDVSVIYY